MLLAEIKQETIRRRGENVNYALRERGSFSQMVRNLIGEHDCVSTAANPMLTWASREAERDDFADGR